MSADSFWFLILADKLSNSGSKTLKFRIHADNQLKNHSGYFLFLTISVAIAEAFHLNLISCFFQVKAILTSFAESCWELLQVISMLLKLYGKPNMSDIVGFSSKCLCLIFQMIQSK